jgi:hypothetical protein
MKPVRYLESRSTAIPIALFLFALLLRLPRLFSLDVWFDEVVLLLQIQKTFAGIWEFCKLDNFPPLYPWLLKVWNHFFPGANSLRFFSAVLGALTPPAAYCWGRAMGGKKTGLLLGAFCAVSLPLIYYSQMIRMYSLFPFFACLSLVGFFEGIRTNQWRYWILAGAANLCGFYTFLFMIFLIEAQLIVLFWEYRTNWSRYIRPVVVHIPVFIIMALWLVPMLQRFRSVSHDFLELASPLVEFFKVWMFFGTARVEFGGVYPAVLFLNLPLCIGFLLGLTKFPSEKKIRYSILILVIPLLTVLVLSLSGRSIFFSRYFLFLMPVYAYVAISGWLGCRRQSLQRLGTALLFVSAVTALSYYYVRFFEEHREYQFVGPSADRTPAEGHPFTKIRDTLQREFQAGEVVIHFSHLAGRSFTFFTSIYYHRRALPEYVFSEEAIPDYFGSQYLETGDRIKSLQDIRPTPQGVWLVTLAPAQVFRTNFEQLIENPPLKWMQEESLLKQLYDAGFQEKDSYSFGKVSLVHFRR